MVPEVIYVAIGVHGTLKVGRTTNPKSRLVSVRGHFKRLGDQLQQYAMFSLGEGHSIAEAELRHRFGRRHTVRYGREWFRDGDYAAALLDAGEVVELCSTSAGRAALLTKWNQRDHRWTGATEAERRAAHRAAMLRSHRERREGYMSPAIAWIVRHLDAPTSATTEAA